MMPGQCCEPGALPWAFAGKVPFLIGERAGTRTQDPVIKSHVLYRLSYALPGVGLGHRDTVSKPKTPIPEPSDRAIPQRFKQLPGQSAAIVVFVMANTSQTQARP